MIRSALGASGQVAGALAGALLRCKAGVRRPGESRDLMTRGAVGLPEVAAFAGMTLALKASGETQAVAKWIRWPRLNGAKR